MFVLMNPTRGIRQKRSKSETEKPKLVGALGRAGPLSPPLIPAESGHLELPDALQISPRAPGTGLHPNTRFSLLKGPQGKKAVDKEPWSQSECRACCPFKSRMGTVKIEHRRHDYHYFLI